MTNNKKLIFGGIIILAVLGLVFYFYLSKPSQYAEPSGGSGLEQSLTPTPDSTPSTGSTGSPQAGSGQASSQQARSGSSISDKPTTTLTPEPFTGLNGIKSPATCQITGEIDFSDKDTFSSKNSKLYWQNVDSQGRLIKWHISPQDSLKIGPNIFGALSIPDGQYDNLTVRLPENPVAKKYLITASITYGQFIQGDVKVKEVDCTGQVKVNLNF